jgi:hypothetical protein
VADFVRTERMEAGIVYLQCLVEGALENDAAVGDVTEVAAGVMQAPLLGITYQVEIKPLEVARG